jgi:hypothetical protein
MPYKVKEALPEVKPRRIFELLRPNLTLPETGCILAIWIAMQMLSQSPLGKPTSALYVIGVMFFILLVRNIAAITAVVLVVGIWLRIAYPISYWEDQHWCQWYCISSLATGHNIMLRSPTVGMSMAAYLPTGDLFGGLFIALGIQKYWYVWQFIDPLLYAIPVAVAPCVATLSVFVGLSCYWSFADYTNAGGNLEINLALLIAAVAAYRHGRKTAAIVFFAFAAMMRQPTIAIVPFVFVLLWQERDFFRIKLFAVLLFLFGGFYILLDPAGAYLYEFKFYDGFQQSFFNYYGKLMGNISISSIPHAFGVPDEIPWFDWKPIYLPITAAGVLALLVAAWRSKKRDSILFFALMAPAFVYVLARGYALMHYVVAAFFPLLSLSTPVGRPRNPVERYLTGGLAFFLLWVGITPLAIYFVGKAGEISDRVRNQPALPIAHTFLIGADGRKDQVPNLDGIDEHHELLSMNQSLEFDFAEPEVPEAVRLTGDHVPIQKIKGIDIWWATRTQARGIIWRGTVEYSPDGNVFEAPQEFSNTLTYEAFPVTIKLPTPGKPARALRIKALKLFDTHDQWMLGNAEFFGHR